MVEKEFLSLSELAEKLGISRIAVYKKVKKGEIKAIRIGRNYAVHRSYIDKIEGKKLTAADKRRLDRALKKVKDEYGETLKLLGRE
ncbi:MAG: helix-turn-helix domain-containing protein [Elusimicrobia bacterium]|nr:helix-turn-helix domain-containing protein [Elusimicrobiota bacterium]